MKRSSTFFVFLSILYKDDGTGTLSLFSDIKHGLLHVFFRRMFLSLCSRFNVKRNFLSTPNCPPSLPGPPTQSDSVIVLVSILPSFIPRKYPFDNRVLQTYTPPSTINVLCIQLSTCVNCFSSIRHLVKLILRYSPSLLSRRFLYQTEILLVLQTYI